VLEGTWAVSELESGAKAEFRRSLTWRVATAVGGLLCTFLLTVVAARLLSADDTAVFLSILAALFLGSFLGRLGLGPNAIRLIAAEKDPTKQRNIAGAHLRATLALSALTAPIVAVIATAGFTGGMSAHIILVAISSILVVCESLRLMLSDIFAAHGRIGASVAMTHHVRSMVVLPFVLLLFTIRSPSLLLIVTVYAAVSGTQLCLALITARHEFKLWGPKSHLSLRSAMREGGMLFTLDLAAFVVLPATIWIASGLFDPADAARYAIAATLAQQVTVIEGLSGLAVTPPVIRLWSAGQRREAVQMLSAVASVCAALAIGLVSFLALFGWILLPLLYGPGLEHAALLLVILAAGGILKPALGGSVILLVASAHIREAARTAGIVLVFACAATVLAAVMFGPIGLAIASSSAMAALSISQWFTARSVIRPVPYPSFRLGKAVRDLSGRRDVAGIVPT
jgi:O-antigen/teichoic acid export membrane protein